MYVFYLLLDFDILYFMGLTRLIRNFFLTTSNALTFESVLADILATTNTRKQSAVTLLLKCLFYGFNNQHYYTCDIIGIKMTYKGFTLLWKYRSHRDYKLHENKYEKHANPLHTFRKLSITSSYLFALTVGWFAIQWHVHATIYNSCDSKKIKNGGPSTLWKCEENQSLLFVTSYQVSLGCYSGYLTFSL